MQGTIKLGGLRDAGTARRPEVWALLGFYVLTVVAVVGYGAYGLHPERLPPSELALRVFAVSFQAFAQLHIVVAAGVLGIALVRTLGLRWILPFLAVCGLSFAAEHIGTGYGVPFGGYGYTGLLGTKLGGRVPFLIPVSWFLMALPSWVLARSAYRARADRWARVALGALWLVAWDLALDPAMSFLTPYWVWEEAGPYYGMPWLNLVGWYVTGLVLLATLEAFADRARWHLLSVRWIAAYYGAVVLMPLGMLMAAGLWGAVAATGIGVGSCAWLTGASGARRAHGIGSARVPAGAVEA